MRTSRKACESSIYHIIVRGVGKQILFEDNIDGNFFLETLANQRATFSVELYAWCLMSNHVHMILHAPLEAVSSMMHAVETRYAGYFNLRHSRSGALFQGRFTSVPIECDEQLLQTIRYIHRNPVKAGRPIDSPWSSFRDYVGKKSNIVTDSAFVLELIGGMEAFVEFHNVEADAGDGLVRLPRCKLTDEEALAVARDILREVGPYGLKALDKPLRDALIVKLRKANLSASQISRITSIGENIIYRARG